MWSFALVEPKSPRMSLTLDAVENNRLSRSLRRGAREGDFRWRVGEAIFRSGGPMSVTRIYRQSTARAISPLNFEHRGAGDHDALLMSLKA